MNTDHSQLLIDIQKKSNIRVSNVRDVKYLKEEIESYKGLKIGYNTLRRLFGFLEQTTPSVNTLNTLANYLESKSYSNYINKKLNFDEWYFQQKILLIELSNDFNDDDINTINFGILYRKNIVYVGYYVANLIQRNNIEILNKIFKNLNIKGFLSADLLKFATIVTHSFYRVEEAKTILLYENLIKHKSFRNSVPLLYVDYSNLNTIYFKVLRFVEKYSKSDSDLFFVSLMRFYKIFYTEEKFKVEEIKLPKNFNKFFPVLKGRYFAYKIMESSDVDASLKQSIFEACKTDKVNLLVEEILPALIIKEEYELLTELSEKFYEEIFESDNWATKTTNSIFLIALANISWHHKIIQIAKINLELVDLEKVELSYYDYVSMFYYQTQIKVSYTENDIETNTKAYLSLKKIVLKTNYTQFLTVTQKYILA
jgi:hypothetical protein